MDDQNHPPTDHNMDQPEVVVVDKNFDASLTNTISFSTNDQGDKSVENNFSSTETLLMDSNSEGSEEFKESNKSLDLTVSKDYS